MLNDGVLDVHFPPDADQILLRDVVDNNGELGGLTFDIAGRPDFIIRFQRDTTNKQITGEIWNADGSNYRMQSKVITDVVITSFAGGCELRGELGFSFLLPCVLSLVFDLGFHRVGSPAWIVGRRPCRLGVRGERERLLRAPTRSDHERGAGYLRCDKHVSARRQRRRPGHRQSRLSGTNSMRHTPMRLSAVR